eukprot:TRINITY_DN106407_c0_g1_i1.p1 TRINITY_DN106407_c0_g1~~TRINITY_DN106407_c0_g1_i1.p1  ORF type:complete len:1390 (+),score=207.56 TRINITY_DN106407_c0_g1_i1:134-4303(+)
MQLLPSIVGKGGPAGKRASKLGTHSQSKHVTWTHNDYAARKAHIEASKRKWQIHVQAAAPEPTEQEASLFAKVLSARAITGVRTSGQNLNSSQASASKTETQPNTRKARASIIDFAAVRKDRILLHQAQKPENLMQHRRSAASRREIYRYAREGIKERRELHAWQNPGRPFNVTFKMAATLVLRGLKTVRAAERLHEEATDEAKLRKAALDHVRASKRLEKAKQKSGKLTFREVALSIRSSIRMLLMVKRAFVSELDQDNLEVDFLQRIVETIDGTLQQSDLQAVRIISETRLLIETAMLDWAGMSENVPEECGQYVQNLVLKFQAVDACTTFVAKLMQEAEELGMAKATERGLKYTFTRTNGRSETMLTVKEGQDEEETALRLKEASVVAGHLAAELNKLRNEQGELTEMLDGLYEGAQWQPFHAPGERRGAMLVSLDAASMLYKEAAAKFGLGRADLHVSHRSNDEDLDSLASSDPEDKLDSGIGSNHLHGTFEKRKSLVDKRGSRASGSRASSLGIKRGPAGRTSIFGKHRSSIVSSKRRSVAPRHTMAEYDSTASHPDSHIRDSVFASSRASVFASRRGSVMPGDTSKQASNIAKGHEDLLDLDDMIAVKAFMRGAVASDRTLSQPNSIASRTEPRSHASISAVKRGSAIPGLASSRASISSIGRGSKVHGLASKRGAAVVGAVSTSADEDDFSLELDEIINVYESMRHPVASTQPHSRGSIPAVRRGSAIPSLTNKRGSATLGGRSSAGGDNQDSLDLDGIMAVQASTPGKVASGRSLLEPKSPASRTESHSNNSISAVRRGSAIPGLTSKRGSALAEGHASTSAKDYSLGLGASLEIHRNLRSQAPDEGFSVGQKKEHHLLGSPKSETGVHLPVLNVHPLQHLANEERDTPRSPTKQISLPATPRSRLSMLGPKSEDAKQLEMLVVTTVTGGSNSQSMSHPDPGKLAVRTRSDDRVGKQSAKLSNRFSTSADDLGGSDEDSVSDYKGRNTHWSPRDQDVSRQDESEMIDSWLSQSVELTSQELEHRELSLMDLKQMLQIALQGRATWHRKAKLMYQTSTAVKPGHAQASLHSAANWRQREVQHLQEEIAKLESKQRVQRREFTFWHRKVKRSQESLQGQSLSARESKELTASTSLLSSWQSTGSSSETKASGMGGSLHTLLDPHNPVIQQCTNRSSPQVEPLGGVRSIASPKNGLEVNLWGWETDDFCLRDSKSALAAYTLPDVPVLSGAAAAAESRLIQEVLRSPDPPEVTPGIMNDALPIWKQMKLQTARLYAKRGRQLFFGGNISRPGSREASIENYRSSREYQKDRSPPSPWREMTEAGWMTAMRAGPAARNSMLLGSRSPSRSRSHQSSKACSPSPSPRPIEVHSDIYISPEQSRTHR